MEYSRPWEACSDSSRQEIPPLFMEPKGSLTRSQRTATGHYPESDDSSPHTLSPYFPKIHSNSIFPSTPSSSKWSLLFRFPNQNIICISHLTSAGYMPCPWKRMNSHISALGQVQASAIFCIPVPIVLIPQVCVESRKLSVKEVSPTASLLFIIIYSSFAPHGA